MVDAVMIRALNHDDVKRFSYASDVPVINGLTDRSHPCQIMADLLTFEEHVGPLEGRTIAWAGDGNNVCASFIHAAAAFRFNLRIACPAQYHPDMYDLARAAERGASVELTQDPREAVSGADAVVTDTWVSMGDVDGEDRIDAFEPFQVDEALMALAAEHAIFLHCLPAHRGEEVTDEVIDGPRSASGTRPRTASTLRKASWPGASAPSEPPCCASPVTGWKGPRRHSARHGSAAARLDRRRAACDAPPARHHAQSARGQAPRLHRPPRGSPPGLPLGAVRRRDLPRSRPSLRPA
jgi:hypothetical protein